MVLWSLLCTLNFLFARFSLPSFSLITFDFSGCFSFYCCGSYLCFEKDRKEQNKDVSALTTNIQHCAGGNKTRKRSKRHPDRMDEVNQSLFADGKILCAENPVEFTYTHTLRSNKCFQQGSRIQNQYTKINYISVHW